MSTQEPTGEYKQTKYQWGETCSNRGIKLSTKTLKITEIRIEHTTSMISNLENLDNNKLGVTALM